MNRTPRRLDISRTTIRSLSAADLHNANAGGSSLCITKFDSECGGDASKGPACDGGRGATIVPQ